MRKARILRYQWHYHKLQFDVLCWAIAPGYRMRSRQARRPFTNGMFPSLRLAYLVLPRALVPVFEAVRGQQDGHTHGLKQAVLADFIDGGHFSAHLRRMRGVYLARRDALVAACAREFDGAARLGPTTAGMNAALHLAPDRPDRNAAAAANAAGLKVLPLSRYSIANRDINGLLPGYAALSPRRIASGIARLARSLVARER